jgi:hypothetical protein
MAIRETELLLEAKAFFDENVKLRAAALEEAHDRARRAFVLWLRPYTALWFWEEIMQPWLLESGSAYPLRDE